MNDYTSTRHRVAIASEDRIGRGPRHLDGVDGLSYAMLLTTARRSREEN